MAASPIDNQLRIIRIERHILEEEHHHPEATGVLTSLLYDIALVEEARNSILKYDSP